MNNAVPEYNHDLVTDPLIENANTEMSSSLDSASQSNFICATTCIMDRVKSVSTYQMNCENDLSIVSENYHRHVISFTFRCSSGHNVEWNSSSKLGGNFTVNYKAMTAYLCSVMSKVAYEKFCNLFDSGMLKDYFRSKAAVTFAAIIDLLSQLSVESVLVAEVVQSGVEVISVMTDARYHCRKNSSHTDHIAIGYIKF